MVFNPAEYDGRALTSLLDDLADFARVTISADWQNRYEWPPGREVVGAWQQLPIEHTTLLMPSDTATHLPSDHPNVSINDVRLETYLGGSAQGWVWSARVLSTGRLVAVKILAGDYVQNAGRAAREALICAKFQRHPNIIRVFHAQPAGSHWVVIMELVRGQNLVELQYSTDERQFFRQLADAVRTMSDNHVVHRDLKPANIVLRTDSSCPVVVDFGLAIDLETPEWNRRGIAGTPLFMSPEALSGEPPDRSWDAYALGITAADTLLDNDAKQLYRLHSTSKIFAAKISGEFDRVFRDTVQQITDDTMRNWCLDLTDSDSHVRMEAIRYACRWS